MNCLFFYARSNNTIKIHKHLEERLVTGSTFRDGMVAVLLLENTPNVDMMKKNRFYSNQLITQYYTGQLPWYIGSTSQSVTNQSKKKIVQVNIPNCLTHSSVFLFIWKAGLFGAFSIKSVSQVRFFNCVSRKVQVLFWKERDVVLRKKSHKN